MDFLINWIQGFMSPMLSLVALFANGFLSATILPLDPSPLLVWVLLVFPDYWLAAYIVVSLGNSLGGILTYFMGWWAYSWYQRRGKTDFLEGYQQKYPKLFVFLQRYGSGFLLLSFLPVIGDALCLMAGALRLSWFYSLLLIIVGKFLRFAVVMGLASFWVF